jgi:hypothetical protein
VHQLSQALRCCELLGIRTIYLDHGFLFITNNTATTGGVALISGDPPCLVQVFSHRFFYPMTSAPYHPEDDYMIAGTFRDLILRNLQHPVPPASALFAHIRSGDLFSPGTVPHSKYGQPPCTYYLEAVDLDNATDVQVIAQDAMNPCLRIVLNSTGATWRARSIRVVLAELIYARKMILARGTLGKAVLFLSPIRKVMFYSMTLSKSGFGRHFDCIPSKTDADRVLDRWRNFPAQIEMMKFEKCTKWNWIEW